MFKNLKIFKAPARTAYAKSGELPRHVFFPTMNGQTILGLPWYRDVQEEARRVWGFDRSLLDMAKFSWNQMQPARPAAGVIAKVTDLCSKQLMTKWAIGYRFEPEYNSLCFLVAIPDWCWEDIGGDLLFLRVPSAGRKSDWGFHGVPAWLETNKPNQLAIAPDFSFLRQDVVGETDSFSLRADFIDWYPALCGTSPFRKKNMIDVPDCFLRWEEHDRRFKSIEGTTKRVLSNEYPPRGKVPFMLLYNKMGMLIFFREAYIGGREGLPLFSLPDGCSLLNKPDTLDD